MQSTADTAVSSHWLNKLPAQKDHVTILLPLVQLQVAFELRELFRNMTGGKCFISKLTTAEGSNQTSPQLRTDGGMGQGRCADQLLAAFRQGCNPASLRMTAHSCNSQGGDGDASLGSEVVRREPGQICHCPAFHVRPRLMFAPRR
mgnify:FL=1